MKTRFKTKADAEAFIRELDHFGIGVFHRLYKGHRHYCVQHNGEIDVPAPPKYQAGDKVEDEKSKVLIGDGTPIW